MAAWYETPQGDLVKNAAADRLDARFWDVRSGAEPRSAYQVTLDGAEPAVYSVFQEPVVADDAGDVVVGLALETRAGSRGGGADIAGSADQSLWRAVVEELDQPLLLLDASGIVADANRAAVLLIGMAREALIGAPHDRALPLTSGDGAVGIVERSLQQPPPAMMEESCELRRADGAVRYVRVVVRPVDIGDRYLMVTVTDQTDAQRMELEIRRTQRLETLGSVAAGLAHDFNNLLTIAVGNISMLRHSQAAGADAELVDAASRALEGARQLNAQLLSFPNRPQIFWEHQSAGEIVQEATRFVVRGSNVAARFNLDPDAGRVRLGGEQLSQVVENLVVNAEQAMPEGGVVEVRVARPVGSPEHVAITVKDEGPGIPRSLRERIFDPYFTTSSGQSGLGLAVAKSIVTQAHGTIAVDSKPGRGTTVTVMLPAAEPARQPANDTQPTTSLRVLVMDDDPSVRETMGRMLERLGCAVTGAQDGVEAVYLHQSAVEHRRPYDMVILDLTVPGAMGGREALARMRKADPTVKAVVTSGYTGDPIMVAPKEHGFCGSVPKPYTLEELSRVLAEATECSA